jgi:hypothetical protein
MRNKLCLTMSLAAAATLAACGGYEPVTPAPTAVITNPTVPVVVAPAVQPGVAVVQPGTVVQGATVGQGGVVVPQLRAGLARVDSITPLASTTPSETPAPPLRRLGLRMDDGTMQFVDTRANVFVGDRVEITNDAHIRTPVAQGPTPARN